MALRQSDWAKGMRAIPYPGGAGRSTVQRYTINVPAGAALGDIFEMAPIPPGCRVTDMVLDCDDIDSGGSPAVLLDVGIMSGEWGKNDGARTCGAEFISGSNVGQAGGTARPTLRTAFRTGVADTARSIGVKIATAAATAQAGDMGLTVTYVAP